MPRGRPRKQVDPDFVRRSAAIGCTQEEIATICGVSVDTIARNFADAYKEGREQGKRSLRRMQWKSAKGGNVTMQIWLGKQQLHQRDQADVTSAGEALRFVILPPGSNKN